MGLRGLLGGVGEARISSFVARCGDFGVRDLDIELGN